MTPTMHNYRRSAMLWQVSGPKVETWHEWPRLLSEPPRGSWKADTIERVAHTLSDDQIACLLHAARLMVAVYRGDRALQIAARCEGKGSDAAAARARRKHHAARRAERAIRAEIAQRIESATRTAKVLRAALRKAG
jgi:hypothetical protein